jgi:chemotaxis protein MotB
VDPDKKPRRRVKKVAGHAAHHGGAWKVAYADFVTAMMALFLVLWLVSQADTKMKQAIASYFRSPGVFDTQAGGILSSPKKISKEPTSLTSKEEDQALYGLASMLQKKFSTRPQFSKYKDQIKIDMTEQGLRIQILDKAERVSFGSGSSDLTPDAKAILQEIAQAVCLLPNPLLVGGHTDRRSFPPDSTYTNWELSADRANAARRALQAGCVPPEQIRKIVGYADTELLLPEDPYSMANRRISITVLKIFGETPVSSSGENTSKPAAATIPIRPPAEKPREDSPAAGESTAPPAAGHRDVTVGAPDSLPSNVPRVREAPRPSAAPANQ